jgi:anti-sigma B factor antagonist
MKISTRGSQGVAILDVDGRMTVDTASDASLAASARDLMREGRRHVLVNLDRVTSIDTTGVRDLVEAYVAVTRQHGSLKLIHLPERVRGVLMITRLLSILEVFGTEGDAIASFNKSPSA